MSKARLVITAVVVEGRTQGEVARAYGVSQGWVSRLVARYRAEGLAAFEPRSRRPESSPRAIPAATVALVIGLRKELAGQGLDAGPHTIAWHLAHRHHIGVSPATIGRCLARAGLVTPDPGETAEVVLPAVRSTTAERVLAGRLHPLPAGGRDRCGDLVLAG